MRKIITIALILTMAVSLSACSIKTGDAETKDDASSGTTAGSSPAELTDKPEEDHARFDIEIGTAVLTATFSDNSSAQAFAKLLGQGEITIEMHDYGSFEKVGDLPQCIVRNDENITTEPGDVILYQGNQITVYYDTNTYCFTRLGKIDDVSQERLKALLGDGNVTATFRLHKEAPTAKKSLVAYFSATGTTKKTAGYVADAVGADLYEIVPATPYTSGDLAYNDDNCRAKTEMNDPSCRPEIIGSVTNMADYDIIFIGYPIWWGEAPRIVSTFIESYDFSGKTVVTFCTSGSSPNNDSVIKALSPGADWISGNRFSSSSTQSDISAWTDSLQLT